MYLKTVAEILSTTPTLCIDADLYLYRAASAAEEETNWGDDIWSLSTDLKTAKTIFTEQIEAFQKTLNVGSVMMCISSRKNHRKNYYAPYKASRKKVRKPVGHKALVEWCTEEYPSVCIDYLEADDVMGILASDPVAKGKRIIVSDDKDMFTIPGKLYRPNDDSLTEVSLDEANAAFYLQSLTGDSTDGYPGLVGVGPVKAKKILGSRPDWMLVRNAYLKAGHTLEEVLAQARCARICRYTDYDFNKEQVIPWSPQR
jgi:DNA polymerase I